MAKVEPVQFTLNAGIYSPRLAEREDTEAYYAAVRDMLNMHPIPEGGAVARDGWTHCQALRGPMAEMDLTGATVTAGAGVVLSGETITLPDPSGDETDPPVYPGNRTPNGYYDEVLP